MKIAFLFILASTLLYGHHGGEHLEFTTMYSLPQASIDQRFNAVSAAVKERVDLLGVKDFPSYSFGRAEKSIKEEFDRLHEARVDLWFESKNELPCQSHPLFKISQDHLLGGRFRQPQCISFEHSVTDSSYNSTCIQVGQRRFFALEGPLEEHVPHFFKLLANWNVKALACLTSEKDGNKPKCFPYWKDRMVTKGDQTFLKVPVIGAFGDADNKRIKELSYIFWPEWPDNQGVDAKELVETANFVRKNLKENEIIAVHCSAGVGRTGTFIAAICILDAIDKQLEEGTLDLNIGKIVYYLNFHRPWLVSKAPQYLTLYRVADLYIDSLERVSTNSN